MKRHADIAVPDLLSALSEMLRVRLCRVLEREELTVGEVADVVQLPQSTVSRHLKALSDTGWLSKRTDGPATYYRLTLDDLPQPGRALWVAVRDNLGDTPELREDVRRLEATLAERMSDSQTFFGKLAGAWDDVRNDLFGTGFTARALLGLLPRDWTIIDAGCGTGNASEFLAPHARRVIAVDASPTMLKAARKRLASFENIDFVRGELHALPLLPGSADAVVCVLVMHHMDSPELVTEEFRRVLRPGGSALIVDMLAHDREDYRRAMGHKHLGFSEERAASMLADSGFEQVRVTALPPEAHARGPSLYAATGFTPTTGTRAPRRT